MVQNVFDFSITVFAKYVDRAVAGVVDAINGRRVVEVELHHSVLHFGALFTKPTRKRKYIRICESQNILRMDTPRFEVKAPVVLTKRKKEGVREMAC